MSFITVRCEARQLHINLLTDLTFTPEGIDVEVRVGHTSEKDIASLLTSRVEVAMRSINDSLVLIWRLSNERAGLTPEFIYETPFHRLLLDDTLPPEPVVRHGRINVRLMFVDNAGRSLGEKSVVLPGFIAKQFNAACQYQMLPEQQDRWGGYLHQIAMFQYVVDFDDSKAAASDLQFEKCETQSLVVDIRRFQ